MPAMEQYTPPPPARARPAPDDAPAPEQPLTRAERATLYERHVCTQCGVWFDEAHNLGRWACRYHPGAIVRDGVYACCGARAQAGRQTGVRGCVRCDHRAAPGPWPTPAWRDRVPRAAYLLARGAAVHDDPATATHVEVARVDAAAAASPPQCSTPSLTRWRR